MPTKIAIIGTGAVGATTAYACLMRNITAEIMLVDVDEIDCRGEVLDLSDALSFSPTSKVAQGNLKQAGSADIIIITAGKAQKEGQTRADLLKTNQQIIKQVINDLAPINKNAIIIMVTNPVDTLTWYAQQITNLPKDQIFGSGTLLDSQRLRNFISKEINIAEQSIHTYILGEHGDSQFAAFSAGRVGGMPLSHFLEQHELNALAKKAQEKVYEIISCKGSTCYGVASCLAATCENIIFDQKRIMPVSTYVERYNVCMSMPSAIGAKGVERTLIPPLSPHEEDLLHRSVNKLKKMKEDLA